MQVQGRVTDSKAFHEGRDALAGRLVPAPQPHAHLSLIQTDTWGLERSQISQGRPMPAGGGARGGAAVIDLHGLHVAEALDALATELARLGATGAAGRRVHILVGTGHHSKARPKALPMYPTLPYPNRAVPIVSQELDCLTQSTATCSAGRRGHRPGRHSVRRAQPLGRRQ